METTLKDCIFRKILEENYLAASNSSSEAFKCCLLSGLSSSAASLSSDTLLVEFLIAFSLKKKHDNVAHYGFTRLGGYAFLSTDITFYLIA